MSGSGRVVEVSGSAQSFELTAALLATAMAGVVVWTTAPLLPHFPDASLPWTVHGVALAVLLAAHPADRVRVSVALALAVWIGSSLGTGMPGRALASTMLLVGQTVLVTELYGRVARGRPPLGSAGDYTRLLASILVGSLPFPFLAEAVIRVSQSPISPGFTAGGWWVAATTSGAALVPILLGAVWVDARREEIHSRLSPQFALVVAVYVIALADAFLLIGPLGGVLPPVIATLPFLAWAGLRHGIPGYAVVSSLLVLAVLASTLLDVGPFQVFSASLLERDRRAWVYLASLIGPAMIFPVTLAERALAERRTRVALAQLSSIVDASGDLIAAVDRDLVVLAVNPAWVDEFERISGVRVAPGMLMSDAFTHLPGELDNSLALWRRALAGERFVSTREFGDPARLRQEYEITYGPVRDTAGVVVGATQVVRNITERRRREAEEAEARRLESIGRLAGGVAHDFNNLMTAVMGYADLIARTFESDDPRRADVAEIERAAGRAGELTQQLLAFARRRFVEPQLVDPGALVEGFSRLLAPLIGPGVTLVVRSAPALHRVKVDPTQFEQVVMNLAVNARDAMPGGGRLVIETANAEHEGVAGVRLSVRDSGTGMSDEVQARIFEPFFTTKPVGDGTGLGLPTVHGIVHQAGGHIEVESAPGQGTAFHIFFPAAAPMITPMLDGPLPPAPRTP